MENSFYPNSPSVLVSIRHDNPVLFKHHLNQGQVRLSLIHLDTKFLSSCKPVNQKILCFPNRTRSVTGLTSLLQKENPARDDSFLKQVKPGKAIPLDFNAQEIPFLIRCVLRPTKIAIVTLIEVHPGLVPEVLGSVMMPLWQGNTQPYKWKKQ